MALDEESSSATSTIASRVGSITNKRFTILLAIITTAVFFHLGNQALLNGTFDSSPSGQQQVLAQMQQQMEKLQASQDTVLEKINALAAPPTHATPALPQEVLSSSTVSSSASTSSRVRVFDTVLFNGELDTLELRLNQLYPVVDFFFILESAFTFQNTPKALIYKQNERRFKQFRDKILYVVIPSMTPADEEEYGSVKKLTGHWMRESYSRNKGFEMAMHAYQPREGDWLMMSDVDEIPRRSAIETLKNPDKSTALGKVVADDTPESGGDILRMSCKFFHYSYEFKYYNGDWTGPVVVRYREQDSAIFQKSPPLPYMSHHKELIQDDWKWAGTMLRDFRGLTLPLLDNQCHHCTWCFANITQVISKIESFSHSEHNQPQFKTKEWILERFKKGMDLFGRDLYYPAVAPVDVPEYVALNREKYSYMVRRKDLPNAGFLDVDPSNPLA